MKNRIFPQLLLFVLSLASANRAFSQETLPELVRRLKPSVVAIITYDANGDALMTGSGFFIRPGQVVTNLHVIRGARTCEVKTLDGKGKVYPVAGTIATDQEGDLAILAVDMPPERPRSSEVTSVLPDEGEKIFVIGNPLKLEGSVSDGIVSAVREVPNVGKIIQITAPISHGNSGSPVFNLEGKVIGVVSVKVTNGQNINLAIASARVNELVPGKLRSFAESAAKEKGDLAESLYRTGVESVWLGNYDDAVGYFENAVNKNPKRAEAWVQVGYCKVKQGKADDAIRAYRQALQLKPDSEEVLNKLGDAYYYAGRLGEAIECYKQAARLRPTHAEAYYNLALAYFENGDRELARTEGRLLRQLDSKLYEKYLSEIQQ